METGVAVENWHIYCIFQINERRGDRSEYANYIGISIIYIPENLHGECLISKVAGSMRGYVGETYGSFRSERAYLGEMFVVKQ